ncbi:MAG: HNH endonuclease signature motif containing protein [Halothece sp. Uz-M2-17]|nr:HNH endonuclease signature motif containing protein [Halothece sp. Uz-M2-17]
MSNLEKLMNYLEVSTQTLQQLRTSSKNAHIASRDTAWDYYVAWRDSAEGKAWKQQKEVEYGYRCPECNRKTPLTIDHKIPRSKAPWLAWDLSNLWLLCYHCNKKKGDKNWSEYLNTIKEKRGNVVYKRILKLAQLSKKDQQNSR